MITNTAVDKDTASKIDQVAVVLINLKMARYNPTRAKIANDSGTRIAATVQYLVSLKTAKLSNLSNKDNQKAVTMILVSINTDMRRFVVRLPSNKILSIFFNSILVPKLYHIIQN